MLFYKLFCTAATPCMLSDVANDRGYDTANTVATLELRSRNGWSSKRMVYYENAQLLTQVNYNCSKFRYIIFKYTFVLLHFVHLIT